jgi:hypothetical protein
VDKESQGSRIVMACVVFILAGPWLIWSSRTELRAAQERYAALMSAPVAQYAVAGRTSQTQGQGKSRKTTWFLHMTQQHPVVGAARAADIKVSRAVHDITREGEVWSARIAAGEPVFDPARTDYEASISRTRRNIGVGLILLAIVLFGLHRSGRLYRPLF